MSDYQKTPLGIEVLKNRSIHLNVRQRRLLILIGTPDFDILTPQFKQRIAEPEVLDQLYNMGLISFEGQQKEKLISADQFEIETAPIILISNDRQNEIIYSERSTSNAKINVELLGFLAIKELMTSLLKQYCGLMAKQLIERIQQAPHIEHLKLCQMQWLTCLQESRLPPSELNRAMQQINQSIEYLRQH